MTSKQETFSVFNTIRIERIERIEIESREFCCFLIIATFLLLSSFHIIEFQQGSKQPRRFSESSSTEGYTNCFIRMLKNKKVLLWMLLGLLLIATSIGIAIPFMISNANSSTDSCSVVYFSTQASPSQKGKLMIVGGAIYNESANANVNYNTTEIIDLDHENSSCHLTTGYPYKASLIQAGVLNVCGKLKNVFCGGGNDNGILRNCSEYTTEGFLHMGDFQTKEVIGSASAVQIFDNFGEQSLWIMGGRDSDYMLQSSTQLISYTRGLQNGPELPDKIVNHCAVALNSTTVMVIGGQSGTITSLQDSSKTFWYNFELGHWIEGPELSIARGRHACTVFETEDELRIYVVGGVNSQYHDLDSVEIAVLDQDNILTMNWNWIEGPRFPFRIREHALVSTNLGLYVIGGYRWEGNNYNYSDSIFELNALSDYWIELPQKMKVPRSYVAALILPEEFAISCK